MTPAPQQQPPTPRDLAAPTVSYANNGPRFRCDRCESSFQRSEHLKRHQRKHEESRPYACAVCPKRFSRSDTLSRHELTHTYSYGDDGQAPYTNDTLRISSQRNRACSECAKARERCSKGRICLRCAKKSLNCVYPSRRRRKKHIDITPSDSIFHEENQSESISQGPHDSIHQEDERQLQSPNQPIGSQFQTNSYIQGQSQEQNLPHVRPSNYAESSQEIGHNSYDRQMNIQMANSSLEIRDNVQNPATQNFNHQASTSVYSTQGVGSQPPPYQEDPGTNVAGLASMNAAAIGDNSHSMQNNFPSVYPPEVFDAAFDASINWLPTNFAMDIDYTSILGFGFASSNYFPDTTTLGQAAPISSYGTGSSHQGQRTHSIAGSDSHSGSNVASPAHTHTTSIGSIDTTIPGAARGALYATSTDGGRVPCTTRSKKSSVAVYGAEPISPDSFPAGQLDDQQRTPLFPNLGNIVVNRFSTNMETLNFIEPSTYEKIYDCFTQLCLDPGIPFPAFKSGDFPLNSHLNYFAYLYFEHFNPVFPVIHKPTVNLNVYWPLALSVASIGSQYTNTEDFSRCIIPMHEFLRRVVMVELENGAIKSCSTPTIQTVLLSQVGMLYSGSSRLAAVARGNHGRLVEICHQHALLSNHRKVKPAEPGVLRSDWTSWIDSETRFRLGYSTWLLDCMRYYHFDLKPALSLLDAQAPLPCDSLWEAASTSQWSEAFMSHKPNPSLFSALQQIYVEGKVKLDIGEFSRVLLLHGIYQETWEVGRYFRRPLCFWQSSAGRPQIAGPNDATSIQALSEFGRSRWLPEIPTYSSWRNAACDCVDVLHWAANGTIAQLNGAEHPTVFHLHFARTVLLVPYDKIRALAASIALQTQTVSKAPSMVNGSDISEAEHDVLQWAQRDEHKARLAILHAGCLYWHVRRYSMRAFYEPAAVFLATLALWAYSSYTSLASRASQSDKQTQEQAQSPNDSNARRQSPTNHNGGDAGMSPPSSPNHTTEIVLSSPSSTITDAPEPTFILLDRPNDDEMVQMFVRSGHPSRMRAYITGVGNVCSPRGPRRILREGRKILAKISPVWGCAREYMDLLEALEQVMAERAGRTMGRQAATG
ncbi:hypothetical protein AOQ84DRAFT_393059 [Glonium stellatum]|uniref:Uncharacterized protein n=1 Tax=Glonium stellatum TaxID=574774 RepID=A0A8E2EP28_9PEZI|nr:hypothetical protein AOQ84DRAFT_393059 [Glonium stellatum]